MGQCWRQVTLPFSARLAPQQQTMDGMLLAYGGKHALQASRDQGRSWNSVASR